MVIIIKDILYYYNIYQYKIISDNSIYWNGKRLLLQELFDEIIFSNINYPFHKPIKNIYNSYITYFNNKKYVLFSSYFEKNRKTNFKDIKYLSFNYNNKSYINYYNVWKRKILYLKNYLDDENDNYYSEYFYGLLFNSLNSIKNINFNNLTYGYCIKDFSSIKCIDDIYNILNIKLGAIVTNISLYIKYIFFFNKDVDLSVSDIINLNLTRDDYLFLVYRLLFPNYYFYNLNNNSNIVDNLNNYLDFVRKLIDEIKKRQIIDMSLCEYLINLF